MSDTTIKKFSQNLHKVDDIEKRLQNDDFLRADKDCLCKCGKPYWLHKNVEGYEWLTILCNGSLVKL